MIEILPGVLRFNLADPEAVPGQRRGRKVVRDDFPAPVPLSPTAAHPSPCAQLALCLAPLKG